MPSASKFESNENSLEISCDGMYSSDAPILAQVKEQKWKHDLNVRIYDPRKSPEKVEYIIISICNSTLL